MSLLWWPLLRLHFLTAKSLNYHLCHHLYVQRRTYYSHYQCFQVFAILWPIYYPPFVSFLSVSLLEALHNVKIAELWKCLCRSNICMIKKIKNISSARQRSCIMSEYVFLNILFQFKIQAKLSKSFNISLNILNT